MHISDENLIAYLMGDASPELVEEIHELLGQDPTLAERLSELRILLGHMDAMRGVYEPPTDLLDNTMQRIDAAEPAGHAEPEKTHEPAIGQVQLSPATGVRPQRLSMYDVGMIAICLAVLCCFILPTVIKVRFESRRMMCAENLRVISQGLFNFATQDPEGRFPQVGLDSKTDFAGVYSVHLKTKDIPVQYSLLQCPSMLGLEDEHHDCVHSIPDLAQLREMTDSELRVLRQVLGGDYAYNLGVTERQNIVAPRYEGRSHFAILSDAPMLEPTGEILIAHDGRGANVVFEDGRILFIPISSARFQEIADHPFQNMNGYHEAGVNKDDSVLAPSATPPIRAGFR